MTNQDLPHLRSDLSVEHLPTWELVTALQQHPTRAELDEASDRLANLQTENNRLDARNNYLENDAAELILGYEATIRRVRDLAARLEGGDHPLGKFIATDIRQALQGDPK